MIPSTDLRLSEFTETHDETGFLGAEVTVAHTESTREFTARVVRGDDGPELSRFDDTGDEGFVRTAFTALWYCVKEFHERDIHPDLGALTPPSQASRSPRRGYRRGELSAAFDEVVDHDRATESPQPDTAVADGGAVPAVQHAPATVTPHTPDVPDGDGGDLVDACPECDGSNIYSRKSAPLPERWRCHTCEAEFPDPNRRPPKTATEDDADAEPDTVPEANPTRPRWLADDPHDIVAAAPSNRSLVEVVEAVVQEENVLQVTRRLAFTQANQTRDVLQQLGLLGDDGQLLEGAELDDRLAALSRWIDDE